MTADIESSIREVVAAAQFLMREESLDFISRASDLISDCFMAGGKILIAGNGGSLCDAMHFAEELTGRFRENRRALPAIALSDPGYLTCISNDFGFDQVFARGVEALGHAGDIFIALTTTGNSQNLYRALLTAQEKKMTTICFLGKTGGKMADLADLQWVVHGFRYSDRIQEAHMAAIHIIIEMIEKKMFQTPSEKEGNLCSHRSSY
ncbi:MAG: SIS domain-containing protein [Chlamydiales bacterium]|nr:SIS domain-containing protein [Chlamydiales bacterium]